MLLQLAQHILRFITYEITMRNRVLAASITLMIIAITATVATAAILSDRQTIHNNGTLNSSPGISVYTDSVCTTLCTSIDWGTLYPGDTATHTVFVKNTGNTTENLSLVVSDWNPAKAGTLMTLNWNKEGNQLQPNATVTATLTLTTQQDLGDVVDFDFNITIQGTV
jgi:uncharacterized repeat protein (TIGR01451 family)